MTTDWLLPAAKEILFSLKDRLDALEEPEEMTVTESVPQVLVLDVSQTVMVALPAANPETVSVVPDRPSETALVLELLDIV